MQLLTLPPSPALATSIRATALVFSDPQSQRLLGHIEQVAPSDASVLIIGETGTGKELLARHIHALSHRAHKPFLAVNCGAFSESLVEAELFGHEKGAFTGEVSAKAGWFEEANGGTLFLDEIGDLPLSIQVKLLRVLQEREVVRLGSRRPIGLDVRVIAATNVQLEQAIAAGNFREDLFYRLNVVSLNLLPLRERPGDILPLARHFIDSYSRRLGRGPVMLDESAQQKLRDHPWHGNIRELENAIHHTLLLVRHGNRIGANDLHLAATLPRFNHPDPHQEPRRSHTATDPMQQLAHTLQHLLEHGTPDLHEAVNATLLRTAYQFCHHNQVHTADLLGISRNVLRSRLIELGELVVNRRVGNAPTASAPSRPAEPRKPLHPVALGWN